MRITSVLAIAASMSVCAIAAPAQAGCLKGAIVGGLAGKLVGHGYAGAAAGCAYGVHRSRANDRRNNDVQDGRSSYNNGNRS